MSRDNDNVESTMETAQTTGHSRPSKGTKYQPVDVLPLTHGATYQTTESSLQWYLRFVVGRAKLLVGVFLLFLAGTILYTLASTPVYRSEATIELPRAGSDSTVSNKGTTSSTADDENFEAAVLMIKSRRVAEAVVDRLHLVKSQESSPGMPVAEASIITRGAAPLLGEHFSDGSSLSATRANEAVKKLLKMITVERIPRTRLVVMAFEARDPFQAQTILRTYLDTYVETSGTRMLKGANDMMVVLQDELANVEGRLSDSKKALLQFTRQNNILAIDDQPIVKTLKDRIALLEQEYADKRSVYDAKAPRMILLENQIRSLASKVSQWEAGVVSVSSLGEHAKRGEVSQESPVEVSAGKSQMHSLAVDYDLLKKEADTNEQIYKNLLRKLRELTVDSKIGNRIVVVENPTLPLDPARPRPMRNIAMGSLFGILAGLMLAFLFEALDPKVLSADEVERNLDLNNLGEIPDINKLDKRLKVPRDGLEFIFNVSPKSIVSESIRNVRNLMLRESEKNALKTILVTSTVPNEGKTLMSVLMASALATNNNRVLIVESDIRKPRMGKVFGTEDSVSGLTALLKDGAPQLTDLLVHTAIPGVHFLPSGSIPADPASLLESDRMKKLMKQCRVLFDYCIFDSAPIMSCSDASILASQVDGVLLVVREGHVNMGILRTAVKRLLSMDATILGFAFNASSRVSSFVTRNYFNYYGRA